MAENWQESYLRSLPAVDAAVNHYKSANHGSTFPYALVVQTVQETVEDLRRRILAALNEEEAADLALGAKDIGERVKARLQALSESSLRRVINATGTVLHTNLGRAPLPQAAIEAMRQAAGYCNLELDLTSGRRGSRHSHAEGLLVRLTGAEAACVVNNNAAAVFLCLNTLANGRKVVVSRGELVEIGGSFRIPDVMAASGAILCEVGTTNKTHSADYKRAIDADTALLLKVHTSNYQVVGFASSVDIPDLAALAKENNLLVMEDLGSGLFVDLSPYGLQKEPLVAAGTAAGVDVLTLSGDKLLGGPQAGIILGKGSVIARIRQNPLMRALRPDKVTLAALEATLRIYLTGDPLREIPVLAMLTQSGDKLKERAQDLADRLRKAGGDRFTVELKEDVSFVGGGAMPLTRIPATVVALRPLNESFNAWVQKLRLGEPALAGRVQDDWLLLDLRTVAEGEEKEVVECLMSS